MFRVVVDVMFRLSGPNVINLITDNTTGLDHQKILGLVDVPS